MKKIHFSIIIGISAVVALTMVVLLNITFSSIQSSVHIEIDGLKEKYSPRENIDFFVISNGYGEYCDGPDVSIFNMTNQSQVVWRGHYPAFTGMYCNPHNFSFIFHAGENNTVTPFTNKPIILNETGRYIVKADLGDSHAEQELDVT